MLCGFTETENVDMSSPEKDIPSLFGALGLVRKAENSGSGRKGKTSNGCCYCFHNDFYIRAKRVANSVCISHRVIIIKLVRWLPRWFSVA